MIRTETLADGINLRLFRYIPMSLLDAAMRAGWVATAALRHSHHGEHAVLCEWLCGCPEAWPLDRGPA